MCDAAHTALERAAGILIPCIAMTAAHTDSALVKNFDRFERARQLRCNRYALDHIGMFEQLLHGGRYRVLNQFCALRPAFCFRNKWAFHVNSSDLLDGTSTGANCI